MENHGLVLLSGISGFFSKSITVVLPENSRYIKRHGSTLDLNTRSNYFMNIFVGVLINTRLFINTILRFMVSNQTGRRYFRWRFFQLLNKTMEYLYVNYTLYKCKNVGFKENCQVSNDC